MSRKGSVTRNPRYKDLMPALMSSKGELKIQGDIDISELVVDCTKPYKVMEAKTVVLD